MSLFPAYLDNTTKSSSTADVESKVYFVDL